MTYKKGGSMDDKQQQEIQIQIGKYLRDHRERKGLTQNYIAELLKVGRTTITMWETGKNVPDTIQILTLADFYKCSIDELIGREIPK